MFRVKERFSILCALNFALGKNLLSWKFSGEYGYLWFILAYTEMIVFYPVYYLLCKDEKISNAARRLLMVFCFMRILLEDFTRIAHLDFPIRTFSLIGAYQLFLLLGFELKLYCTIRENFPNVSVSNRDWSFIFSA